MAALQLRIKRTIDFRRRASRRSESARWFIRSWNPRWGVSKLQHPERRPTVAPAVYEVSPIGRDCRLLEEQPGLLKVRDLLYGTTVRRHAVNVQVVWLEI